MAWSIVIRTPMHRIYGRQFMTLPSIKPKTDLGFRSSIPSFSASAVLPFERKFRVGDEVSQSHVVGNLGRLFIGHRSRCMAANERSADYILARPRRVWPRCTQLSHSDRGHRRRPLQGCFVLSQQLFFPNFGSIWCDIACTLAI